MQMMTAPGRRPLASMLIPLALAALCLPGQAAAQDTSKPMPLTTGHGALMFNLGGLFSSTPSNLDGVGVGGRYFMSDGMAIRGALGISRVSTNQELDPSGIDQENRTSLYAVEAAAEWVMFKNADVYIYAGGLAQLSTGSEDPEGDDNDTSSLGLTLAGVAGANWFFSEATSIGAEYRLGLSRTSTEVEQGNSTTTTTETRFGVGAVGFHLAFWF